MANLREIKKRINSVSTTEQITRTMEMVSTAKIGRALNREKQSEAYRRAITDVMLTVADDTAAGPSSPLLVNPASYDCALLIVINSDRGLAGGFNVTVERAAEKRIDHFRRHGAQRVELITFAESLGGAESLITYPLVQTHGSIPARIRDELGIGERLLRLSVGLEDADDLIRDLDQALA